MGMEQFEGKHIYVYYITNTRNTRNLFQYQIHWLNSLEVQFLVPYNSGIKA